MGMRSLPKLKVLALCLIFSGALGIAFAANVNARIKGTVTDPNGAVLTGAKVTATNEATGVVFDTVTGSDGGYLFPQLPVGSYTINVSSRDSKASPPKVLFSISTRNMSSPSNLALVLPQKWSKSRLPRSRLTRPTRS